jgi:hypothetical protein
MATRRLRAQNLTPSGDLEPLGDGFSCLAARNWLRHKARKICAYQGNHKSFLRVHRAKFASRRINDRAAPLGFCQATLPAEATEPVSIIEGRGLAPRR